MPISSILKAGIKALPEDTVVPAESVPNLLKKQGVKDEEIQFSGVELPKEGKVTKADLEKMESERLDIFNVEVNSFNWVNLAPGRNNPTYKEKVLTYSEKGAQPTRVEITDQQRAALERNLAGEADPQDIVAMAQDLGYPGTETGGVSEWLESGVSNASRYTSSHFEEIPNYLMHTRIYDDTIDGVPTRVVAEIQSDLHQAGRKQGYDTPLRTDEQEFALADLNTLLNEGSENLEELNRLADLAGMPEDVEIDEWVAEALASQPAAIPKSPFEKTWLRKGLEREISDAIDEGRSQIAIPISGAVEDLKRAPGVQKWYETTVVSTAQKLAKSAGMDFEMKTVDGVGYAVVKPKVISGKAMSADEEQTLLEEVFETAYDNRDEAIAMLKPHYPNPEEMVDDALDASSARGFYETYATPEGPSTLELQKPNFALYASPGASAFVAYTALKAGYAQEDVEAKLAEDGYGPSDIQEIMQNTQIIADAKAAGYDDADIKAMLEQQEVQVGSTTKTPLAELEPPTPNRFTDAYAALMGADEMTPKEMLAKMETVYPDNSFVTTNIAGFFGDQEAKRISDESVAAQRNRITAEAAKRGLNVRWDEGSGEWLAQTDQGEVVVTPEWYRSFWESKGEFVLGFTGGTFAAAQAMKRAPGGVKGKLLAGLGVVGATAVAAIAGTELDYLHSAMVLQQDFEAEAMARKAFTSAELSVIGDAAAIGLIKVGGASWRGMKNAVEFVRGGFLDRAGTALEETFFITKETAEVLVKRLERVADVPAQSDIDRAITGVALTRPGGEELVSASVHTDPRASRAVVKAIDDRAKDLLSSTQALEGEAVGRFLRDELEGYTSMVRDNFARVKAEASAAPRSNNFKFDYDKLALDPVLQRLLGNIENKDLAYKFAKQSQRIRDMSKSRRLGDLIELRQLVNEFRYNKRISNAKDYQMLDEIRGNIDTAVRQGAYATMENPQRWLAEWKTANRQYSEMKELQKNALYKVLQRPGVSEKVIGQALAKYAPSLDGTFVDVMAKLPKKTRERAEGAVLNNLAEKYTAGAVDGVRATDFPALAKELEEITMTSPESRKMKKAIGELAQVFKNDQPLSQASGGIQVQKFAQALTTDPVAKAKFAFASHMFHYVRSLAPTKSGRASALIVKTAQVLENPVNSKTIKELTEMLDGEVNVAPELEELVKRATLQQAEGGGMPRMKLYGDGKILAMKGAGTEHSIPMHRVARTEDVRQMAEAAGINMADKKALDILLRDRGYLAVQLGENKVRLLSE